MIENTLNQITEHYILDLFFFLISLVLLLYIYDRFVQRKHQLLINYPVIGRMRYVFETLREPLRQYFSEETFYESRDKIDWVYRASKDVPNFMSFSVSQPFEDTRFIIKHSNTVLNDDEVSNDISVTFGKNSKIPFVSSSVIERSGMSDGALSPEATRAFAMGAKKGNFPINTGEGGLTSNYFYTHSITDENRACMEIIESTPVAELIFKFSTFLFNGAVATKLYRHYLLHSDTENTYIYDPDSHLLFRPNWEAPLSAFPKEAPKDMPDIILQIGSGLYGVRDKNGNFDKERYAKVMSFCKMTEIKIAQGAKQTGGKIIASKVTHDIAYYRGVEAGKDLISPNRFPYAESLSDLFDFVGELQEISGKPVGIKIVVSDIQATDEIAIHIAQRKIAKLPFPDFITVDGGDGGSATAPLELMENVGLKTSNALFIVDSVLRKREIRDDVNIISSGKILTPDDVVILLSLGADMVGIARGFMMSGGCIRARQCAGVGSHVCPVGMATQDKKKRASFLVVKQSGEIANYHNNLIKGIKTLLSVMGVDRVSKLNKYNLAYKNRIGEVYFNIEKHFNEKLHMQ